MKMVAAFLAIFGAAAIACGYEDPRLVIVAMFNFFLGMVAGMFVLISLPAKEEERHEPERH